MTMASTCTLLDLPDLALYKICTFINCPFDLLHFGSTCSRIRNISVSQTLWWSLALHWLRGLWMHMEEGSVEENPRDWLLDVICQYSGKPITTKKECLFGNNETWTRVDSRKFRFLSNLLRVAYTREKDDHPAVLYEQWLYDIGVYRRSGPGNFEFIKYGTDTLCHLSQAAERDLRRRKQPYKSLEYYIKPIACSEKSWKSELFPAGMNGSICPLLICPFRGCTTESSSLHGLAMCLSVVLEKRLKVHYKSSSLKLKTIWEIIKVFCTVFVSEILLLLPDLEARLGTACLRTILITVIEENSYDVTKLQSVLDYFSLSVVPCEDVLQDLCALLKVYSEIHIAVDDIRSRYRKAINDEIEKVLFPPETSNYTVTRINLTDSDMIGGDNYQQEMSCAAFVTDYAVLVTWHLTGRAHYLCDCNLITPLLCSWCKENKPVCSFLEIAPSKMVVTPPCQRKEGIFLVLVPFIKVINALGQRKKELMLCRCCKRRRKIEISQRAIREIYRTLKHMET